MSFQAYRSFIGVFSSVAKFATENASITKQATLSSGLLTSSHNTQCRARYANWQMRKDVKRRNMVAEYAPERLRINSIRKNDIIPLEIQEMASREIAALPLNSCKSRICFRCAVSSRPKGNLKRWRLSRIIWRNLADYNQLSGVTRASW